MSGWGTQLHTRLQQCITVYTVTHTVYQCFMQRALQEGVATWRGSPQVAANTRLSPRLHQMFSTLLVSMSSPSRFLCFPHFYFWIWASRPTLRSLYLRDKGVGVGPNANGFIKTDPADDASQFTTKLPQTKYFGSLLALGQQYSDLACETTFRVSPSLEC